MIERRGEVEAAGHARHRHRIRPNGKDIASMDAVKQWIALEVEGEQSHELQQIQSTERA